MRCFTKMLLILISVIGQCRLLKVNPMERLSVSELMEHPWLQENRTSNIELNSPAIMLDKVKPVEYIVTSRFLPP